MTCPLLVRMIKVEPVAWILFEEHEDAYRIADKAERLKSVLKSYQWE